MSDSLTIFGTDYTGVTGIKATGTGNGQLTYIRPAGTKSITANGTGIDVTEYASVDVSVAGQDSTFVITVSWNSTSEKWEPDCTYAQVQAAYQAGKTIVVDAYGDSINATADGEWNASSSMLMYWVHEYDVNTSLLKEYGYNFDSTGISVYSSDSYIMPNFAYLTKTYTPTETQQTENITIPSGKNGINSVDVTVNAISSSYVGSGVTRRSSSDLTASGATVTAPAGYYENAATKAVSAGTEGTPTATKGTVSNHSVSVTPSVTNSAGYISGGTHAGTAVTVSASELVSGTLSITSSGTKDVTNYASASIAASDRTASATKGTVSNHQVSITPVATTTAGFVNAGNTNGAPVTVQASELVSGNLALTDNTASTDCTNYATVSVAIPFVTYYTSSSSPTSSQGSNGDIWLVTTA